MANHVDRLYAAVAVLAGHGHIKQRLISAYEDHIDVIKDDEIPIAAREAFADLKQKMYQVAPLNGEGPICASVRKMSIVEASECASSVVEMYREVCRQGGEAQVALPLDQNAEEKVPPFLVKTN